MSTDTAPPAYATGNGTATATFVMSPERWELIHRVVRSVLEAPESERENIAEQLCGDDPDLLNQVRHLLWDHSSSEALGSLLNAPHLPRDGDTIGPYRIERPLGRGGMGVVYLARREDVGKQVALKLVTSIASAGRVDRLLAERRILARLQHPNIAQLLDAGRTDEGSPFFAMEYVDGARIDLALQEQKADLESRVQTFVAVCRAVHFAHQRAVVHRDLKPSNIFVTTEGVVKLLDFGIAKLLDEDDALTELTETSMRLLTPAYASPEQVRAEAATTVSDVYSLGVVLYEILCGTSPYRQKSGSRQFELEVLEHNPAPPSRADGAPRTETGGLPVEVDADLDAVCMKALRKTPADRYASAEQLAEDLERWLGGFPVLARDGTTWYAVRRFARRHRTAAAGTMLVLSLLVAWAVTSAVLVRRLANERDRAQLQTEKSSSITEFLVDLFEVSDPDIARGADPTARELLEKGAAKIDSELAGQGEIQAELMNVMARVYHQLGLFERAEGLNSAALERWRSFDGDHRIAELLTLRQLGTIMLHNGNIEQGQDHFREVLDLAVEIYGPNTLEEASALQQYGESLSVDAQGASGIEQLQRALKIRLDNSDTASVALAMTYRELGESFSRNGQPDPGLKMMRQARQVIEQLELKADELPYRAEILNRQGIFATKVQEFEEAEEALQQSIELMRQLSVDRPHKNLAIGLANLGELYLAREQHRRAEVALRESVEMMGTLWGSEHPKVAMSVLKLARVLSSLNDPAAEPLFRESIGILEKRMGAVHPHLAAVKLPLAAFLFEQGRVAEALPIGEEVLEVRLHHYGEEHYRSAEAELLIGRALSRLGRHAEAEPLLKKAIVVLEKSEKHDLLQQTQQALDELYATWPGHQANRL